MPIITTDVSITIYHATGRSLVGLLVKALVILLLLLNYSTVIVPQIVGVTVSLATS